MFFISMKNMEAVKGLAAARQLLHPGGKLQSWTRSSCSTMTRDKGRLQIRGRPKLAHEDWGGLLMRLLC